MRPLRPSRLDDANVVLAFVVIQLHSGVADVLGGLDDGFDGGGVGGWPIITGAVVSQH